jgi:hypothetical protein
MLNSAFSSLNFSVCDVTIVPAQALADERCQRCLQQKHAAVHKIRFRFLLDRAPPGCPPESSLCPACDSLWGTIGHTPLTVAQGRAAPAPAAPAPTRGGPISGFFAPQQPRSGAAGAAPAPAAAPESDYQAALAGKRGRKAATAALSAAFAAPIAQPPRAAGLDGAAAPGVPQTMCSCGAPAKLLTVLKEGTNRGRPFFSCAKPRFITVAVIACCTSLDCLSLPNSIHRGQGCPFFEWADEAARPPPAQAYAGVGASSGGTGGAGAGAGAARLCRCGAAAVNNVVRKEGPNLGRYFFACKKARYGCFLAYHNFAASC